MLKTWIPAFAGMTAIFVCCGAVFSADPVDSLIEQEKKGQKEWTQEADELPPAFFWGDKSGAEIYTASAHEGKGNLICEPLPFDELVELSRGDPASQETVLNVDILRVRELLQKSCLIRPGDPVLAIGDGWQKRVLVKDFVVKKDRPICPQDSPYSLWVSFDEPLAVSPIFFSTDQRWKEGDNKYVALTEKKPIALDAETRRALNRLIADFRDYDVKISTLQASNIEKLFVLRRKNISPDDDGLPNELLLWQSGQGLEKLWVERLDIKKGSGHLQLKAALDFDGDGLTDLLIIGDHAGCPYAKVFRGDNVGFSPVDLPLKPCACW